MSCILSIKITNLLFLEIILSVWPEREMRQVLCDVKQQVLNDSLWVSPAWCFSKNLETEAGGRGYFTKSSAKFSLRCDWPCLCAEQEENCGFGEGSGKIVRNIH